MKTRTTRRRPVTVQLGERSLEIQAPGFKAIRRGAERQFYWIKDDHAEFALYEPKTVRIYIDGLDPEAACERIQRICLREQEQCSLGPTKTRQTGSGSVRNMMAH